MILIPTGELAHWRTCLAAWAARQPLWRRLSASSTRVTPCSSWADPRECSTSRDVGAMAHGTNSTTRWRC